MHGVPFAIDEKLLEVPGDLLDAKLVLEEDKQRVGILAVNFHLLEERKRCVLRLASELFDFGRRPRLLICKL